MVSQLGEEIKTQNAQPRSKAGYFRGRNRFAVTSYLGSEHLVNCVDIHRSPDVLCLGVVSNWVAYWLCALE